MIDCKSPSTQWLAPIDREANRRPVRASAKEKMPSSTAEALLGDLQRSIGRGYWKLAIRRFLMMRAYEFEVPAACASQCLEYIALCPDADLRKIGMCVDEWVRWCDADITIK